MLIMTFQAIWGTMRGHGPFLAQTPAQNATALQLFLLVTATPLMLLAVVIEEERRSKDALRESANLMGLAADAGNLGMWVWDVSGNDVRMTGIADAARASRSSLQFFAIVAIRPRATRDGGEPESLRGEQDDGEHARHDHRRGLRDWHHARLDRDLSDHHDQ